MTQNFKKILKISAVLFFFIFIFGYSFFRSYDLIFGVKIKNVNLVDDAKTESSVLTISGNAKNATKLVLNGREISIDMAGDFEETVALLLGHNVINIRAEDKFGHIDEKNYQVMH